MNEILVVGFPKEKTSRTRLPRSYRTPILAEKLLVLSWRSCLFLEGNPTLHVYRVNRSLLMRDGTFLAV